MSGIGGGYHPPYRSRTEELSARGPVMNALAVPEPPKLSTCARDGHHEGFDLGIRYYPAFSPQKRWVPMEVLPTLKKRTKKKSTSKKLYTYRR